MKRVRNVMGPVFIVMLGLAGEIFAAAPDGAADWPQIRGPRRDGVSTMTGLLRSWPEAGPRVVWKRPFGEGFSAITIAGGRLYTMASDGTQESVHCLDVESGEEQWRTPVGATFREEFGDGPRSTPAVEGDTVYALGAAGKLVALRTADGSERWALDLPTALNGQAPGRGYSTSPLIDGDLLLLEVGGAEGKAIVALDRSSGAMRWTAGDGTASYSSPIAVEIGGVRQYVFARRAGSEVVALKRDGAILWRHPGPPTIIAMPLFLPPDRIFISAGDDAGGAMLRIVPEGEGARVEELWRNRLVRNHFNASVQVGDQLYGFDNATFKCVDISDGSRRWARRGFGKGSLVTADGLLIALSDRGALILVEATPEAYRQLGQVQAMEGKSWTAPTLAGGRVYLRDQDEITCLDLTTAAEQEVQR